MQSFTKLWFFFIVDEDIFKLVTLILCFYTAIYLFIPIYISEWYMKAITGMKFAMQQEVKKKKL